MATFLDKRQYIYQAFMAKFDRLPPESQRQCFLGIIITLISHLDDQGIETLFNEISKPRKVYHAENIPG
jgi:hypothetical protein